MRDFSALCARMYRFSANSRATISSTAIFLSQQSRQYFSSPLGSETSLAPHRAQRDLTIAFRGMVQTEFLDRIVHNSSLKRDDSSNPCRSAAPGVERPGP